MKAAVAICYFHRKIGPMVFYLYPEEGLLEEEKRRLSDVMDQSYEEEGFFRNIDGSGELDYTSTEAGSVVTDEKKWSDKWFRSLAPCHKIVWIYICDSCDIAGFYEVDIESISSTPSALYA